MCILQDNRFSRGIQSEEDSFCGRLHFAWFPSLRTATCYMELSLEMDVCMEVLDLRMVSFMLVGGEL